MAKKKMVIDTLNFVGAPTKYKRAVTGPLNSKETVKAPKGYHFTDNHKSHKVTLNGNTYNFYVTKDVCTDVILFKGPYGTKSRKLHRSYNSSVYIKPPKYYRFNDDASTKKITCRNTKHSLDVKPTMVADQIIYTNDKKADTTVVGTYGKKSKAIIPKHYQLKNSDGKFVFNGGIHKFTIKPSVVKNTLVFKNHSNNHSILVTVKGVYGKKGQTTPPTGYCFAGNESLHKFRFDGKRHEISIKRLTTIDKVIYVNKKHKKIAEKDIQGAVLNSAKKDIDQYVPSHYHVISGDDVKYSLGQRYYVTISDIVTDHVIMQSLQKIILTKKGHYHDTWIVRAPDNYHFKGHKNEVKINLSGKDHSFKLIHDPYQDKLVYTDVLTKKPVLSRNIIGYAKNNAKPSIEKYLPKHYKLITNVDNMTFGPLVKFNVKICHKLTTVKLNYVYNHQSVGTTSIICRNSFVIGSYPKGLPDNYKVVNPATTYKSNKMQRSIPVKPFIINNSSQSKSQAKPTKRHGLRRIFHKVSNSYNALVSLITSIF